MSEKKPSIAERLEALCEKWIEELERDDTFSIESRTTRLNNLVRLADFANSFYEQSADKEDYEGLANRVAEILVEKAGELPAEDPNVEGLDPSAASIPPMPKVERITFQILKNRLEVRKDAGEILAQAKKDTEAVMIQEQNGNKILALQGSLDALIVQHFSSSGTLLVEHNCFSTVGILIVLAPVQEGSTYSVVPKDSVRKHLFSS